MTYQEINQLVESLGLPYAYYSFPEEQAPELPFIVFYYPNYDDLGADNINYQKIAELDIELYTANKDIELEQQIEQVLTANDLFFVKSQTYIKQEQMYEVLYEIEIVINEGVNNG